MADQVKNVRLRIEDKEMACEKETLCRHSDYFKAMFNSQMTECHQDVITLQDVSYVGFQCIWNHCLTGSIDLDISIVPDVMMTSQMLQFHKVHALCADYLNQNISAVNCLTVLALASQLSLEDLKSIALSFVCLHFEDVIKEADFRDIGVDEFEKIIKSSDINIESEIKVFEAITTFLSQHESKTETAEMNLSEAAIKLFRHVRFSNLSHSRLSQLMDDATAEKYNLKPRIQDVLSKKAAGASENITKEQGKGNKSSKSKHTTKSTSGSDASTDDAAAKSDASGSKPASSKEADPKEKEILTRCYPHECIVAIPVVISKKPKDNEASDDDEEDSRKRNITKAMLYRLSASSYELEKLADIPIPKCTYGYQVCSSGRYIYVVGGEIGLGSGKWVMDMWRYDGWTHEWAIVGRLDEPRRNHALTSDEQGNLYVAGGFSRYRQKSMTISKWNGTGKGWSPLPDLPVFIYQNSILVTESTFYACSGFHMQSFDLSRIPSGFQARIHDSCWRNEQLESLLREDQKELLNGIELPTGCIRHVIHDNKLYFIAEKVFTLDLTSREVALVCDMSKVDVSDNLNQCIPELSEPFYYHIGHDVIAQKRKKYRLRPRP